MEQYFLEAIKGQGLPFIMACIAIAWIQNMNKAMVEKLNDERNQHLKSLGTQIQDLKDAIIECERDRKELWSKIMERDASHG